MVKTPRTGLGSSTRNNRFVKRSQSHSRPLSRHQVATKLPAQCRPIDYAAPSTKQALKLVVVRARRCACRYYIGLIPKEADSNYGVSFPDFPCVVTAGTSLDDAQAMAEEALARHVDGLLEDGEASHGPALPCA